MPHAEIFGEIAFKQGDFGVFGSAITVSEHLAGLHDGDRPVNPLGWDGVEACEVRRLDQPFIPSVHWPMPAHSFVPTLL